jgi:N-carbamoylputrescine amidase
MSKSTYKIAVLQLNLNDIAENNLKKCISWVREAAKKGAEVISLPELYSSHYFCQTEDTDNFALAEPLYSTSFIAFSALAKELGVVIIVPFFERRMAGIYHNSAYIIDTDGTEAGLYRKMHIPDDPHFYEKFYFTPGDIGFKTFPTKKGKIGTLICWDQWYPEAARITSLMGAEMLFYPTAIGWATAQDEATNTEQYNAWQTIQRSHAVANGVPVISVNRVGLEQDGLMQFWGGSFVSNPFGTLLYKASHDQEEIAVVDIDTEKSDSYRTHWPFLRDRRIDSYEPITKRYIDDEQ